jgi:hypothetical protein
VYTNLNPERFDNSNAVVARYDVPTGADVAAQESTSNALTERLNRANQGRVEDTPAPNNENNQPTVTNF